MLTESRSSHGVIAYGSITSILFVGICMRTWAIFCNGDMNLWNTLVFSLESGFVLGNVRMLIHRLVAFAACRSCTVRMLASASAMAVATVLNAPVIACAPILCTLFSEGIDFHPHASIQTLEHSPLLALPLLQIIVLPWMETPFVVVLVPWQQEGLWLLHLR